MRKLFIGGPADGEWIDTNDKDYVRLRKKEPVNGIFTYDTMMSLFGLGQEPPQPILYIMQQWTAEGERIQVFAHDGQPPAQTLHLLIKHYHPNAH